MAKYAIDSTTLTGIADAIREKTKTTASVQTSKMAEAILAIKGGLSVDVVTASTLPAAVTDGQIVVITDTTPGTVYIDTDEPASPASGDLWVKLEAGADVALELTEESPLLQAGLFNAAQWNGSTWDNCDAHLGVNGVWEQFSNELPPIGTTLEEMSWSDIAKVQKANRSAEYFSVGDRKGVAISGTVNSQTINGTYYCFIIGINHNEELEGKGLHFQFAKTALSDGTDIAFDANYSGTASAYVMNTTATSAGGWGSSYMRSTICAQFLAALPEELQAVIKLCTKYTDNVGKGSTALESVTATEDSIWLPSLYEVTADDSGANPWELEYQEQYAYYAAGNSVVKYRNSTQSSAAMWWLRTPNKDSTTAFKTISGTGSPANTSANKSYGFAPCFMV